MRRMNLDLEQRGPVMYVWLDRPQKRNALDTQTLEEIADTFAALQSDFETRVVVLAGRGAAFCAGADRTAPPGSEQMLASSGATDRERRQAGQLGLRACRAIESAEQVTIARIHGYAIGGGLALAMACDFRIASDEAYLQYPEVDLGLPLTWGAAPRLIAEVGAARAREILLLCERIDVERAERIGLLHRVATADDLESTTAELAERLAAKPEIAVHMTKSQLRAYQQTAIQGDLTELDGDLLLAASRAGVARTGFQSD